MSNHVIGIVGKAGAGKDSLADIIVRKADYCKMSVSDPIKEIARLVYNIPISELWCASEGKTARSRKAMQDIGSALKQLDRDIWINALKLRISNFFADSPGRGVVITDLRFPEEIEAVRTEFNATIVMLERPYLTPHNSDHPTETAVDYLDQSRIHYLISNHGCICDLECMCDILLEDL